MIVDANVALLSCHSVGPGPRPPGIVTVTPASRTLAAACGLGSAGRTQSEPPNARRP